jgi:hypothetical protein
VVVIAAEDENASQNPMDGIKLINSEFRDMEVFLNHCTPYYSFSRLYRHSARCKDAEQGRAG